MGKWTKKTWTFGKTGERGKIEAWYDDGDPPTLRIIVFTDPDGTVRKFDRRTSTASITKAGGTEEPKTASGFKDKKKSFVYTFDKEGWEIVVKDDGTVTWKKKTGGKDDNDTFDPKEGTWEKDNPPKEWPKGKNNVGPKTPTEKEVDAPKSP